MTNKWAAPTVVTFLLAVAFAVASVNFLLATSEKPERLSSDISTTTATTQPLSADDAFLADLYSALGLDNPNPAWGEQAISTAKQMCEALDAGRDVASAAFTTLTLDILYESAGAENLDSTAAVLAIGAQHYCTGWAPIVAQDAERRGLVSPL